MSMTVFEVACVAVGLPRPIPEYRFDKRRQWRFDWAFVDPYRIAVEIEGGAFRGHGHRSVGKFLRDIEKYNEATIAGWKVLRCTTDQFKDGTGLELVMRAVEASKVT